MSINDLIHTNAHNAFEQGVKTERERILKLLEENFGEWIDIQFSEFEQLIKGEQK